MKSLGAVVVVACALAAPRSAEACHSLSELPVWMYGAVAIPANGAFTVLDLALHEPSRGYGVAETLATASVALIGVAAARYAYDSCEEGGSFYPYAGRGARVFSLSMIGWSTVLFAHGIYTIARPRAAPTTTALLPVPVSSDEGELLGFGVAGQF